MYKKVRFFFELKTSTVHKSVLVGDEEQERTCTARKKNW